MGSWEWGGLREAVGAGLPTRNDQKALYFLAKRGGQGKPFYPAHPFFVGFSTFSAVRRPPAGDGASPGAAHGKAWIPVLP